MGRIAGATIVLMGLLALDGVGPAAAQSGFGQMAQATREAGDAARAALAPMVFHCDQFPLHRPWVLTAAEDDALHIRPEPEPGNPQWIAGLTVEVDRQWINNVEQPSVTDDKRKMGRYDRQIQPPNQRQVQLLLSYALPGLSSLQVVTNGTEYRGEWNCQWVSGPPQ
jgi:hypothetical protein